MDMVLLQSGRPIDTGDYERIVSLSLVDTCT